MSDPIGILSAVSEPKRRSRLAEFFGRLVREKPLGTISGIIILILIFVAIFADVLAPYPYREIHLADILKAPSAQYLPRPRGPQVRRILERAFREYGLPWTIRSDNGPPFASVGLGSLSPLAVWWVKLGIVPERIEPGHPEQNGRLERLHRTLKAETASPPRATTRRQQRAFDTFRQTYNIERPHEALGQQPPARRYHASPRSYPSRVRGPEYDLEMTVRQVRTNGQIKWKGNTIYLSESLKGEPIGLKQRDNRFWTIYFGPLSIGLLDDHARCILNTPTKVLPMSPV